MLMFLVSVGQLLGQLVVLTRSQCRVHASVRTASGIRKLGVPWACSIT